MEEVYANNKREWKVTFGAKRMDITRVLQRELSQLKNIIRN
ncbi:hypothetical protein [Bacillus sp. FDAARGOS_1420]|nr:hypothetical protein [Bacillus sp. FDAARGOS_1420]